MGPALTMENRRLPLHELHARKGARFGTFGGWEVPLYYTTILAEHRAVRERSGLFDISHMGEFWVEGGNSAAWLDYLLPRPIEPMQVGQALYMPLLNEQGGILDDVIVYRFGPERFLLIVNAANREKDFSWFSSHVTEGLHLEDATDRFGLLALQGPASASVIGKILRDDAVQGMRYYRFRPFKDGMISRTGYTGEDGFEIMVGLKELPAIWEALDTVSAGFGARDTLRLEAGMLLHGHDMDEGITPLEARLDWAVDLSKRDFLGRKALLKQKQAGVKRLLIGFEMMDRAIARQDHEIVKNDRPIGRVTSGSFAPTLGKNIGLGFVPAEEAREENEIGINIRGIAARAKVVKLPFYKRSASSGQRTEKK